MFIVSLTYKVPLEQVDEHMDGHMAWLKEGYASGMFIASGRKNPRTGGVILAKGEKDDVAAFCAKDPFIVHDVASVDVTEVSFSMAADGLEILKEA